MLALLLTQACGDSDRGSVGPSTVPSFAGDVLVTFPPGDVVTGGAFGTPATGRTDLPPPPPDTLPPVDPEGLLFEVLPASLHGRDLRRTDLIEGDAFVSAELGVSPHDLEEAIAEDSSGYVVARAYRHPVAAPQQIVDALAGFLVAPGEVVHEVVIGGRAAVELPGIGSSTYVVISDASVVVVGHPSLGEPDAAELISQIP